MTKNIKVKNTTKKAVLLSVDLGLSLAPGEVMALNGDLLKKALKIKGVKKTKEEVGINSKGKASKPKADKKKSLKDMNQKELRAKAKEVGVKSNGTNAELVERIREASNKK